MDIYIKLNGSRGIVFNKQPYFLTANEEVRLNFQTEFRLSDILIECDGKAYRASGNTFTIPDKFVGEKALEIIVTQHHNGQPCHCWKCDEIKLYCADIGYYEANALYRALQEQYQTIATRVAEQERAIHELETRIMGADIL